MVKFSLKQVVIDFANSSLEWEIGAAEENCASKQTTCPSINETTSCKSKPVEVVIAPESREDLTRLENSLLLSCVETDPIK